MNTTTSLFKIALIEDDNDDCELFTLALKEVDHSIELRCYSNCVEFLRKISVFSPDLIFLDLHLSQKHGFECLTDMQTTSSISNIPVIIYTGSNAHNGIMDNSIKLGAKVFFEKPGSYQELITTLKYIVSCDWNFPQNIQPLHIKDGNFTPISDTLLD